MPNVSADYAGVDIAVVTLLDYEINERHAYRFKPVFRRWLDSVIDDNDFAEGPPENYPRDGQTRGIDVIEIDEIQPYARGGCGRHAQAILGLAWWLVSARETRTGADVAKLLAKVKDYRRDTDNAWALIAEMRP